MTAGVSSLLPVGLADSLPPQAGQKTAVIHAVLQYLAGWGYQRVEPPLLEFVQAPQRGVMQAMDPVSQQMLELRHDMTAPMGRIASTRLAAQPRPLRLSYAGSVVRAAGTALRPERQFTQLGIECIGSEPVAADAEVICLAQRLLAHIGVRALTVDVHAPVFVSEVLAAAKALPEQEQAFYAALAMRNRAMLDELPAALQAAGRVMLTAQGNLDVALLTLEQYKDWPEAARHWLERLRTLSMLLQTELGSATLTLDVTEERGVSYHEGITFSLFASGARGEIGRGGRYRLPVSGETGVGFSVYLEPLLPLLPAAPVVRKILVPHTLPAARRETLQAEGFAVVRHHADTPVTAAQARAQGCSGYVTASGAPVLWENSNG